MAFNGISYIPIGGLLIKLENSPGNLGLKGLMRREKGNIAMEFEESVIGVRVLSVLTRHILVLDYKLFI